MEILCKDNQQLQQKINAIKQDGISQLHIISDFDKTMTKAFADGKKVQSSFSLLREGGYLGEEYVKGAFALFDEYYPFEVDPTLSDTQRNEKMTEWWGKHWNLMIQHGINQAVFDDIIAKGKLELRENVEEVLSVVAENKIPLLIFSSGLGNLIKTFLEQQNLLTDNVHLISNFFQFENGNAISFTTPQIHVFNKNEYAIKDTDYYTAVKNRKNVILIGDSLGDVRMADGMEHDTVLRIGILIDPDQKDRYLQEYDVVLPDGSLEYVLTLLASFVS